MSNLGTFDTFTTAQLGIYAAQHGLRVTGNNISNISTDGYTRQRIDQVSFKVGGSDLYRSQLDNHVGNGAMVTGISQIRDPYLDIRYRNTNSTVGYTDTWLDGLKNISSILNEVGKGFGEDEEDGLLYAQLQDLADALRGLGENPCSDNDTLVRTSAEALCTLFNTYAGKLETLRQNTEDAFKKDVASVNTILTNIRNLNEEIRNSEIHGDNALEMRDERNRQIDALSEYMHINVVYSMEDIGAGQEVEKLTITLANDNPDGKVTTDSSTLIDGVYGSQISTLRPMANKNLPPDYDPNTDIDEDDPATWPYWNEEKGEPVRNAVEATPEESPNYDITISKLYDSKGRLWTNPVTSPPREVPTKVENIQAKFSFDVKTTAWKEGDTIEISGTTYTIGDGGDIPLAQANTLVGMAKFIADRLNTPGYTASPDGASIILTADTPGPVANLPELMVTDPGTNLVLSDDPFIINPGTQTVPDVPNRNPKPEYEKDPVTGATLAKIEKSYTRSGSKWYEVVTRTEYSHEVALDDNDLYGSLQASRELLTEKGEFADQNTVDKIDEKALSKRGIPYYQLSLDLLARQVATQYNSLNQGYMVNQDGNYIDENGKVLTIEVEVEKDNGTKEKVDLPISKTNGGLTDAQKESILADNSYGWTTEEEIDMDVLLKDLHAKPAEGMGNLFSIRNDKDVDKEVTVDPDTGEDIIEGITAANITVSHGWSTGNTKVVTTYVQLFGEDGKPLANTTQCENVNHMITMIEKPLAYDPKMMVGDAAGENLFTGGFNDMFSNIMSVEGKDQRIMNVKLTSSYGSLVELDSSRDGVSGVDLNDEAMNMMQYQKAYSAACRMMTVIDEVLDRLINNTGVAGR